MRYLDAISWLDASVGCGVKCDLRNMQVLAKYLGQPQRCAPAIQITGTNGKGSVAVFLSAILHAAGWRVGTASSPHLIDARERVCIDGVPAGRRDLALSLTRVRQAATATATNPTYFEIITMAGFDLFARQRVDVQVVEVGVGGRRDATSIIHPEVAVVTEIGRDHTRYLGEELHQIAREKVAIVRRGSDAVFTPPDPAMRSFLSERAREQGAARILAVAPEQARCLNLSLTGMDAEIDNPLFGTLRVHLSLVGRHQLRNALAAVYAAECLARRGWPIVAAQVRHGLESARWPARFHCLRKAPLLVIDGAHNPDGAAALAQTWREAAGDRPTVLVFGIFADKNKEDVIRQLAPLAREVLVTIPPSERAMPLDELAGYFRDCGVPTRAVADPIQAVEEARARLPRHGAVLAAGSLYLAGHLFAHYRRSPFRLFR